MNISGSSADFDENPIVGSLHFYQDGEMGISLIDNHEKVSASEISTLIFTTEFFMYALEREDWLLEYMENINTVLREIDLAEKKQRFTVIEGGLKAEEDHN